MRRPERVAELIREEITQIVGYELDDPRLRMVTVTDVRMSENLRDARIYVTVTGSENEIMAALAALRHAAPYVRKQLGLSLNLRHTPEIHFVRDTIEENATRVDNLLAQIEFREENESLEEDSKKSGDAIPEILKEGEALPSDKGQ
jgi:ribosome-binding factor A